MDRLDTTIDGQTHADAYAPSDFEHAAERLHTRDAEFFEYSKAANPIGAELTPLIPFHFFPSSLYTDGPSRVVPLDLSADLKCDGPATGPGLCANFVRLLKGDALSLEPNATSLVFYVIGGIGRAACGNDVIDFHAGDFFTLPGSEASRLSASSDCTLYYVNDAPLLAYLGVNVASKRFAPTLYTSERANHELGLALADPNSANRSRISVLLGNANFPRTRTVTHVLWAMYGIVTPGTMQKPHRHQSIALDFIVDCDAGCYSLVGDRLDDTGEIADPTRVDWEPGSAFVTPPGYWHAHFNTSRRNARLIPIQDAGLQTYLRTLDIRFT